MDDCPYCGGYLGGAYACPTCGTPAQQAQYTQQASYPQQGQHYSAQYPQYTQHPQYQQPQQYDQTQAYAAAQQYTGQEQYPGQAGVQSYDGYPAAYAADPTVAWHESQQQTADYAQFDSTPADGTAHMSAPEDRAERTRLSDLVDDEEPSGEPSWTAEPAAEKWSSGADDDEDGQDDDCEPDRCGRARGRRGRSRHRTLKLVLGTATGFVLAGALITVLPNELLPTSHSAQDSTPEADAQSSDVSGTPDGTPPAASQTSGAPGANGQAGTPTSAASATATHRPSAPPPTHTVKPTQPPGTQPPSGPTQTPPATTPPPPQHTHSPPPQQCVLICWN